MTTADHTHSMHQVDLQSVGHGSVPTSTEAAEVLVVGSEDWGIRDAIRQLTTAGRTVHRCSETADAPFPCYALIEGRGCPLNTGQIDVVLNIRTRADSQPSLSEMGAICGLRDGLPLVIAGRSETSGLAPWAELVPVTGDIVSTCDDAVQRGKQG
jgi:hypothetical protein